MPRAWYEVGMLWITTSWQVIGLFTLWSMTWTHRSSFSMVNSSMWSRSWAGFFGRASFLTPHQKSTMLPNFNYYQKTGWAKKSPPDKFRKVSIVQFLPRLKQFSCVAIFLEGFFSGFPIFLEFPTFLEGPFSASQTFLESPIFFKRTLLRISDLAWIYDLIPREILGAFNLS